MKILLLLINFLHAGHWDDIYDTEDIPPGDDGLIGWIFAPVLWLVENAELFLLQYFPSWLTIIIMIPIMSVIAAVYFSVIVGGGVYLWAAIQRMRDKKTS